MIPYDPPPYFVGQGFPKDDRCPGMTRSLPYHLQFFAKDDGGEKTEPATAKKLADARKEGQVAKSKEVSSAVDLVLLFVLLKIFVSFVGDNFLGSFREIYLKIPDLIQNSPGGVSIMTMTTYIQRGMIVILLSVAPFFIAGVLAAIVVNVAQVGWKPTAKPMKPKLSKISPLSGIKRIFSTRSLFELVKAILRIILISYVAYSSVKDYQNTLLMVYDIPFLEVVLLIGSIVIDTGYRIGLVYILVALADFIYQKYKFNKDQKMSKQEVKDEYKNTEGNPEIKGRQRQRMREASQRRMMHDLPTADVVITNPTHLAVAIKYDGQEHRAPQVIAKGEGYLALKIREMAKENNIEIVENKPLARMLYANVELFEEIPPELYQAVAEVLALVYNTDR
ncbi:flagellar biosynthetic protein FlhB [Clostridia bacterium]|nr:flagellar biosynthetic protein FlhB [Clostridia bacterium]